MVGGSSPSWGAENRWKLAVFLFSTINHIGTYKEVEIPQSTYYDIIKTNPDAIAQTQEIIDANNRYQLGMVLYHNNEILQKMTDDGLTEDTSPGERVAIHKYLKDILNDQGGAVRELSEIEKRAQEFLRQGPSLSKQPSRLTATQSTVTIESKG